MYELVLLDADETIFDFKMAEKNSLKACFKAYGIEGEFDELREKYTIINRKLWDDLEAGKVIKNELNFLRFKGFIEALNLDIDPKEMSERYLDEIAKCSYLLDGAYELCEYLKSKYRVFILTNGIKNAQISRIENSTIKGFIDGMVVSSDIGISKPDPKIFEYTLEKANHTNKESVIMIGDSLTADIRGGNNFGIDTLWVNLKGSDNEHNISSTYEIRKLSEIQDIL